MPPPGTGVLSFGLVAIPVRIHTATHSENVSFHLLDNKCGSRVRKRHYCPVCNNVVERAIHVRLFDFDDYSLAIEVVHDYSVRRGVLLVDTVPHAITLKQSVIIVDDDAPDDELVPDPGGDILS
jgi:hypothetical protein